MRQTVLVTKEFKNLEKLTHASFHHQKYPHKTTYLSLLVKSHLT